MSLNPKDDLHWQATAEDADWTAQSPHTAEKQQQLANPQVQAIKQQRKKRKPRGLVAYNEDDEDEEDEEITESDEETESEKDHQSERSTTEGEEKATPPKASEVSFTEPNEQTDESRLKSQISTSHDLSESLSVQLGQFDKSSTVTFEVEGECDPDVERRVIEAHAKLLNERRSGNSRCFWNDTIQSLKAFRNPSIYEKLVEFIGIDEKGSNFDPLCAVYNVAVFGRESFYDELARAQHEEMERITAHQKAAQRAKVEFVSKRSNSAAAGANQSSASGTAQLASANLTSGGSSSNLATSAEPQPKRRSKWDAPAGSAQSANSSSKPSAALPASVSK